MNTTKYEIEYEKGLVERGSCERIRHLFRRALAGEDLTVGFLGGSITQGSVATEERFCYAYRVYDWFVHTFPNARFTYVNAGIGATDSEFAAARAAEDLLSAGPDFVLLEFAVNEGANDHFTETYEGTVRQILNSKPGVALVTMNNVFYNEGSNAERIHRRVARHYDLPALSMRTTIYDAILAGRFEKEEITPDDLHPNDEGHGLVARVITTYLESVLETMEMPTEPISGDLPAPLTPNRYEHSIRYDNRNSAKVLKDMHGFCADETPRKAVSDCFRYGYSATADGSYAEYEVKGSCIAVIYTKTVNKPAPVARAVIDGDEANAVILDANFMETWGDKLELTDVYMSDAPAVHTVRVEIVETHPDDRGRFYLGGIIVSG